MTTFKIGQTVRRVEGSRETAPIEIKNDYTLKYVQDFVDRGYEFKIVRDVEEDEFDLPTVEASPVIAARVHIGGSVCVGCEG